MVATVRRKTVVEGADGTPLSVHLHGEGGGPVVVLTNGIGTTENFWRFIVDALKPDYTVVHWDYRGHGSTPLSKSGDYSLRTHADDLARITRAVTSPGGAPPIQLAFSMGVSVLLELYRDAPELVRALGLIAGAPDAPGTGVGVFRVPGAQLAARTFAALATPMVPLAAPFVKLFLRSRLPFPVAQFAGVLQRDAPREEIDVFLEGVAGMDPLAYWKTLRSLLAAHASDVLPRVTVPTLIMAAEDDLLMPLKQVEQMRRGIPHARYVAVPNAGHAGLVERGDEMARAVRTFVDGLR